MSMLAARKDRQPIIMDMSINPPPMQAEYQDIHEEEQKLLLPASPTLQLFVKRRAVDHSSPDSSISMGKNNFSIRTLKSRITNIKNKASKSKRTNLKLNSSMQNEENIHASKRPKNNKTISILGKQQSSSLEKPKSSSLEELQFSSKIPFAKRKADDDSSFNASTQTEESNYSSKKPKNRQTMFALEKPKSSNEIKTTLFNLIPDFGIFFQNLKQYFFNKK